MVSMMDIQHPGMVAGVLHGGERVGLAADGIELLGDLKRAAPGRSLENHMFDEMGQPALRIGFVPRPHMNPDAHGDGAHMGHRHGKDTNAVVQNGFANLRIFVHLPGQLCD